jgi:hypothetical protein
MTDLVPGQQYYYKFGTIDYWSKEFTFRAALNKVPQEGIKFFIFGDSGTPSCQDLEDPNCSTNSI